jgi:hypothetical protein
MIVTGPTRISCPCGRELHRQAWMKNPDWENAQQMFRDAHHPTAHRRGRHGNDSPPTL